MREGGRKAEDPFRGIEGWAGFDFPLSLPPPCPTHPAKRASHQSNRTHGGSAPGRHLPLPFISAFRGDLASRGFNGRHEVGRYTCSLPRSGTTETCSGGLYVRHSSARRRRAVECGSLLPPLSRRANSPRTPPAKLASRSALGQQGPAPYENRPIRRFVIRMYNVCLDFLVGAFVAHGGELGT